MIRMCLTIFIQDMLFVMISLCRLQMVIKFIFFQNLNVVQIQDTKFFEFPNSVYGLRWKLKVFLTQTPIYLNTSILSIASVLWKGSLRFPHWVSLSSSTINFPSKFEGFLFEFCLPWRKGALVEEADIFSWELVLIFQTFVRESHLRRRIVSLSSPHQICCLQEGTWATILRLRGGEPMVCDN